MSEPMIVAEGLSKAYRIWANPASRLYAPILEKVVGPGRAARHYQDFWALHNVSFTARRGEALGIIGRNGSGKSTLLQLIAGTLQPTQGRLTVQGRVAALLELGAGFNVEFTGRENVYLNGTVLGFSRRQIDERLPAIAAFADIGDFFDQPVRTYSSGMIVRLAFAVAAHVDPDILIIDEALSVGDARFQLKCARTIDQFINRGVTLIFVSHDAALVKRLCRSAILLERGHLLHRGAPNDVVNLYSKLIVEGNTAESLAPDIAALQARPEPAPAAEGPARPGESDAKSKALLSDEREHVPLSGAEYSYGGERGRIHSIAILGGDTGSRSEFSSGEQVTLRMVVSATEDCPEPIFAITVKNTAGVEIYGTNTLFSGQSAPSMAAGEYREVDFSFGLNLIPGEYFVSFGFTAFEGEKLAVVHRRYDALQIQVSSQDRSFGIANLQAIITSRPLPAPAGPSP